MRAVELFTGAGGLALGTARAGFHHAALVEFNRSACNSIRLNKRNGFSLLADATLHEMDVRSFDYANLGDIHLVAGGPPCQPFSIGGKHRGFRDDRDMFPEAVRAVRALRPKAFVFENVKGLLRRSFATYFEYIILQLTHPSLVRTPNEDWESHRRRLERHHTGGADDGLRYNVVFNLVNAADYGVSQRRERVIIVGFRSDQCSAWSFPKPTHSQAALQASKNDGTYWERHGIPHRNRPHDPAANTFAFLPDGPSLQPWRTVRDAIADLPDPTLVPSGTVPNHVFIPGARPYPGHTGSPLDEPAKTLKADRKSVV